MTRYPIPSARRQRVRSEVASVLCWVIAPALIATALFGGVAVLVRGSMEPQTEPVQAKALPGRLARPAEDNPLGPTYGVVVGEFGGYGCPYLDDARAADRFALNNDILGMAALFRTRGCATFRKGERVIVELRRGGYRRVRRIGDERTDWISSAFIGPEARQ